MQYIYPIEMTEELQESIMNTSEAARKWKCSVGTVRKYCNEGMIPPAEKIQDFRGAGISQMKHVNHQ